MHPRPRSALPTIIAISTLAFHASAQTPSTFPATTPTTTQVAVESPDIAAVTRGTLDLISDVSAVFVPVNPYEARPRFKRYAGELVVRVVAPSGAAIKKGDVLLELEQDRIAHEISAAENELALARANHAKAEADAALGVRSDELAMQQATLIAARAETALAWWDKLDQQQVVASDEINKAMTAFQTESQEDELAELRKMYESEDLTNETTDIVLKRATRMLELFKMMLAQQSRGLQRTVELETGQYRENLAANVPIQKLGVEQLKVAQQHATEARQSALASATLALAEAQDKLTELKSDAAALTIRSPIDGVVVYGSISNEMTWTSVDARSLQVGEKVQPNQPLLTVYSPGRMNARLELVETHLAWLTPGQTITLRPLILPGTRYEGVVGTPASMGTMKEKDQLFDVPVELSTEVDPRLPPLSRGVVTIDGGKVDAALLVPATAVVRGKVYVRDADGKTTPRRVITGRSNGDMTEILEGLHEGEKVLIRPPQ